MFDYENRTAYWVNRLSFVIRAEAQRRFRAAGYPLTAEEWAMLMLLWGRPPQTMTELAAKSLRDRTTVTRLIDSMVAKDLLIRENDPADRRRILIMPSDKGAALEGPLSAITSEFLQKAAEGLDQVEIDLTNRVLARMMSNLTGDREN